MILEAGLLVCSLWLVIIGASLRPPSPLLVIFGLSLVVTIIVIAVIDGVQIVEVAR